MSRMETAMTIGSNIVASCFSHVFCCGLLPLALNASASALLSGMGMQIGMAIVTTITVAAGVTLYEKHRHENEICKAEGHCHCATKFDFARHFLRNLAIGVIAYTLFNSITHLPSVHHHIDQLFNITHTR